MSEEPTIEIALTPQELRHLIAVGPALAQNVSAAALPTYCLLSKDEIVAFSSRMRAELDRRGLDM
jgi:hypothetical protein